MDKILNILRRPQVYGSIISVAVMAILAIAFFYPDNFEGRVLQQPDMQQGAANGHEAALWEAQTGEKALWTNSLFGGMPTFQISPSYPTNSLFTWLNDVYGLWLPAPSNLLFMMMVGFFIMLMTLGKRWYFSLLGAVAWGFSSYFIIIIGAGHIWKFLALTYVPPTIAGLILIYRNKRIVGAAMLALFAMLQLNANHPQMTYYFGLVMACIAIAFLVEAIRKHTIKAWLIGSATVLAAGVLALGANAPSLYNTYEYSKETKRNQSELAASTDTDIIDPTAPKPTGGMPYEQIVGWSYGRSEMFTLLVPNVRGGASAKPTFSGMKMMSLADLPDAEKYDNTFGTKALLDYCSQYFQDSEGTNGPVYVGVIIGALFILGCCIVRGPLKWALLSATIASILLALGANFTALTDLMIYHFPLYNKFRAVESILVIAEFTMPFMAVLALIKLAETGAEAFKQYKKQIFISFGAVALICLAAIATPSLFGSAITQNDRYISSMLQQQYSEYLQSQGYDELTIATYLSELSIDNPANIKAIESLRYGMVRADGWRSLIFLVLGMGAVVLLCQGDKRQKWGIAAIAILVVIDLFNVNKRYVSSDSFGTATNKESQGIIPDAIDQYLLQDTSSYRVLDIPGFQSANRSYFHHMIGGYHAAKLSRYDDIIQYRLSPMVRVGYSPLPAGKLEDIDDATALYASGLAVANMLNAKYVITGDPKAPLVLNTQAQGNAWFVDSIIYVDGARQEMDALDVRYTDLRHQAIIDNTFAEALTQQPSITDGDTIELTSYSPNSLKYQASTSNGGVAVFSEVYFPWGWKAEIDGEDAPIARANYILRAIAIPPGTHQIAMTFAPESIVWSSRVAYVSISLIYLLLALGVFYASRKPQANTSSTESNQ